MHFTSTDGGELPTDYAFTGIDGGVHTFTNDFSLDTSGSQTITAADLANSDIVGSTSVMVTAPEFLPIYKTQDIGIAENAGMVSTDSIFVASDVRGGDSIILEVVEDGPPGAVVTVTDSAGNAYNKDAESAVRISAAGGSVRTQIFSAIDAKAAKCRPIDFHQFQRPS